MKKIDIVDISAISTDIWQSRLESVDVLMVGGGNPYHLVYWAKKSGFDQFLRENLPYKVYIGISAGSMLLGKKIFLTKAEKLEYPDSNDISDCLKFVDFSIRPHLNSATSPLSTKENVKNIAGKTGETIYTIDDETAIKVIDKKIEVITEGKWLKFN